MNLFKHTCNFCGNEYKNHYKESKYCSQNCYKSYKKQNPKLKEKQCPICQKIFKPHDSNTIYCSRKCSGLGNRNRIICFCENCGKQFERIKSEVDGRKTHFCSKECVHEYTCWSDKDKKTLSDNYGKLPYREIIKLLDRDIKPHSIGRMAIELGLTENYGYWTNEEINILIENYSTKSMSDVMKLLPNRSKVSIKGQSNVHKLKSSFYLNRCYTDDEINYIKENYAIKSYEEMSIELGRTVSAIKQRMIMLDLRKPTEIANYQNLYKYIRQRIIPWRNHVREKCNYTCEITGDKSNIIVHHIKGFNLLLEECIKEMKFPLYEDFSLYTQDELDKFLEKFLQMQEASDGGYICITKNVHDKFHSMYGYGNNTKKQWEEFIINNYN